MFQFTHILNASTGERFQVRSARLAQDEEFEETPSGENLFELCVLPEWEEAPAERKLYLEVSNSNRKVQITKNLSVENYLDLEMAEALIEGRTIITVNHPEQEAV